MLTRPAGQILLLPLFLLLICPAPPALADPPAACPLASGPSTFPQARSA